MTVRTWLAGIASAGLALTTLVTLSSQPAAAAGDEPGVMIIGGNDATENYSFAARLLTTYAGLGVARCTGSFVTDRGRIGVATNAHCVSDLDTGAAMPASTVQVQAGSTHLDQLTTLQATRVEVFPTWDWGTGDDPFADVAVVNVTIPAGLRITAVPLADWVRARQKVRLLGWGKTFYEATEPPAVLQQLDTRLTAHSACATAGITAGELCVAPAANGGQACFGDSGGPALGRRGRSWVVLGGASRGTDESTCTGPLVYTDFVYYSRWIGRQLAGEHTPRSPRHVDPRAARRFWGLAG
ncbi:serine protease [Paractinoplanes ferrugineus]|uniref:Serine protease n=1 Tax=Paractinoplanes ferrugineus TaxID=113564 RepID=A0A919J7S4_9ACTN|nr:trypsin-like serine protease [Actinoplanes ferrugineus]GIE14199.1 serine protease [Actinoplanes ferrugineus]